MPRNAQNTQDNTPTDERPEWLKTVTDVATEAWNVSKGKFADYTLSIVGPDGLGAALNLGRKAHAAHDLKTPEFYKWASGICGKAKGTIDQYVNASIVFPDLPERFKTIGNIPQIAELSALEGIAKEDREAILVQVHEGGDPVVVQKGNEMVTLTDTESAVRELVKRVKQSAMTDDEREKSEKQSRARSDKSAKDLRESLNVPVREAFTRVMGAVLTMDDVPAAMVEAFMLGANFGQDHGSKGGPRVSAGIASILVPTDADGNKTDGNVTLTDDDADAAAADAAALAAEKIAA